MSFEHFKGNSKGKLFANKAGGKAYFPPAFMDFSSGSKT